METLHIYFNDKLVNLRLNKHISENDINFAKSFVLSLGADSSVLEFIDANLREHMRNQKESTR